VLFNHAPELIGRLQQIVQLKTIIQNGDQHRERKRKY
jgi:hypothetical protein